MLNGECVDECPGVIEGGVCRITVKVNVRVLKNPYLFFVEVDEESREYVGRNFVVEEHFQIVLEEEESEVGYRVVREENGSLVECLVVMEY